MKVYLFISNHKKLLKMYLPYIEALNKQLDITNNLVDADIVLIIGAWTWQGAQIAKKAKQMDIPYIVCPLGDISESYYPYGEKLSGKERLEQAHRPDSLCRLQSSYQH